MFFTTGVRAQVAECWEAGKLKMGWTKQLISFQQSELDPESDENHHQWTLNWGTIWPSVRKASV